MRRTNMIGHNRISSRNDRYTAARPARAYSKFKFRPLSFCDSRKRRRCRSRQKIRLDIILWRNAISRNFAYQTSQRAGFMICFTINTLRRMCALFVCSTRIMNTCAVECESIFIYIMRGREAGLLNPLHERGGFAVLLKGLEIVVIGSLSLSRLSNLTLFVTLLAAIARSTCSASC